MKILKIEVQYGLIIYALKLIKIKFDLSFEQIVIMIFACFAQKNIFLVMNLIS
jgi:hypothetical protein